MLGDFLVALIVIFVAAIWRAISVKRMAPDEKHSIAEYADAFLFPGQDHESSTPEN